MYPGDQPIAGHGRPADRDDHARRPARLPAPAWRRRRRRAAAESPAAAGARFYDGDGVLVRRTTLAATQEVSRSSTRSTTRRRWTSCCRRPAAGGEPGSCPAPAVNPTASRRRLSQRPSACSSISVTVSARAAIGSSIAHSSGRLGDRQVRHDVSNAPSYGGWSGQRARRRRSARRSAPGASVRGRRGRRRTSRPDQLEVEGLVSRRSLLRGRASSIAAGSTKGKRSSRAQARRALRCCRAASAARPRRPPPRARRRSRRCVACSSA